MTYEEQIENVLKHINIDIKTLKGRKEKEAALNELEFDAICLLKTILLYRGELWNKRTSCDTCAMYYPDDGCMAGLAEEAKP